jgi:hypothetical protein
MNRSMRWNPLELSKLAPQALLNNQISKKCGRLKYWGTGLFQFAICDRPSLKLRLTGSRFAIALS